MKNAYSFGPVTLCHGPGCCPTVESKGALTTLRDDYGNEIAMFDGEELLVMKKDSVEPRMLADIRSRNAGQVVVVKGCELATLAGGPSYVLTEINIQEDGDMLLTMDEFISGVVSKKYANHNGYGYYATDKYESDLLCTPSMLMAGYDWDEKPGTGGMSQCDPRNWAKNNWDNRFTHILWYNR